VVQARDVSGGVHFHRSDQPHRRSDAPAPRQLPADVRGFVNRADELERLDAVLMSDEGYPLTVSVCVIAGTAGAGKTSLAVRWAHQVKDRFPDGQLYTNLRGYDAGQPVTPDTALHRFLTALGIPRRAIPNDPDAAAALYRSLLAERRVLVVLDNAATEEQVRPLLPGGRGCLTLVTSRSRLSGLAIRDGAQRITLGTLPDPEAVALLRAVTDGFRPADDADKLAELARLCARLPLASRVAAERAVSNPHLRLDDLIAELRDESVLWHALSTGDEAHADAVRTVFAWSYRALPASAARLFRLLGLHPGPEFSLDAAAVLADLAFGRARQLLDTLVGAHLLEQTAPDRYQFHDLLRAFAADQARVDESQEEREAALNRLLAWYLHTLQAAGRWITPDEAPAPSGPGPSFSTYDQAMDWAEREDATFPFLTRAAEEAGDDRLAWQLPIAVWNAWPRSSSVSHWLPMARAGLQAARGQGAREAEVTLLEALGYAHVRLAQFAEAAGYHEETLALRREAGEREGEALSLNALGLIHMRQRRFAHAEDAFKRALRLFQETGDPRMAATTLSNLAVTHHRAGHIPEASGAVEQALAAHRTLGNERGEGNALRVLSDIQRERGEHEDALRSAQQAVDIATRLRNRALEGYWLLTLADAQRVSGQYGDAMESYQRAAALHRRLGDRSREALALQGAGETYQQLDRPDEAAAFHRQAAAAFHALADPWHEALALNALATALHPSDHVQARAHWTEALRLTTPFDDPRAVRQRRHIEDRLTASR
jgi:tetratricopeptide (TPR) repeat protein